MMATWERSLVFALPVGPMGAGIRVGHNISVASEVEVTMPPVQAVLIVGSGATAHSPALYQANSEHWAGLQHVTLTRLNQCNSTPTDQARHSGSNQQSPRGTAFYMGLDGASPGSGDPLPGLAPGSRWAQGAPRRAPCGQRFPLSSSYHVLSPSHHAARVRSSQYYIYV